MLADRSGEAAAKSRMACRVLAELRYPVKSVVSSRRSVNGSAVLVVDPFRYEGCATKSRERTLGASGGGNAAAASTAGFLVKRDLRLSSMVWPKRNCRVAYTIRILYDSGSFAYSLTGLGPKKSSAVVSTFSGT